MIVLPFLTFALLAILFCKESSKKESAAALVKAFLAWFLFIAVTTEVLSYFGAIEFKNVVGLWLCFGAGILVFIYKRHGLKLSRCDTSNLLYIKDLWPVLIVVLGTLVTALVYPPNNWDSMTYHMSRVCHWIENREVSFYASSIVRQNFQMPFAEYVIMHFQILSGGDWFANVVQWMCFVGVLFSSYSLTAEFVNKKWIQFLSVICVSTIPMAIMQASSTQNDLVVSFFVSAFCLFLLRSRRDFGVRNLVFASISLGLALLTKGTAYLYVAPLGICLSVPIFRRNIDLSYSWKRKMQGLASLVFFALTLNVGHYSRNYGLYGHPLSTEGDEYTNEVISLQALSSNILRNAALHIALPPPAWNEKVDEWMYRILGDGINDSKTTWPGTVFDSLYSRHEDGAGNLLHLVLGLFVGVWFVGMVAKRRSDDVFWFALGVLTASILYCLVLKWQPWASRLHTPLFTLLGPLIAIAIGSIGSRKVSKILTAFVGLGLFVYACPYVFDNMTRSLIAGDWRTKSRVELYFPNRPYLIRDYQRVVQALQGRDLSDLGFFAGENDWEYPFWVMLSGNDALSIRHVWVENQSASLDGSDTAPELVIATRPFSLGDYGLLLETRYVSVFERVR